MTQLSEAKDPYITSDNYTHFPLLSVTFTKCEAETAHVSVA